MPNVFSIFKQRLTILSDHMFLWVVSGSYEEGSWHIDVQPCVVNQCACSLSHDAVGLPGGARLGVGVQEQWLIGFPIVLIVHVKSCPWYGGDVACSH